MVASSNKILRGIDEGVYIINSQYQIVYIDESLKVLFPHATHHDMCYKTLRKNKQPCVDCPLNNSEDQTFSPQKQLLYNELLNCWVDCTMIKLDWPDEGECTLISLKRVGNVNRNLFLNFNDNIKYNQLIEFNTNNNSYEMLFYDNNEIKIDAIGNLHTFIEKLCFQYVHPNDQESFRAFWELPTLKDRVEKLGNISDEFRLMQEDGGFHWVSFYINPVQKANDYNTYLCFTINVDKKYQVIKNYASSKENFDSLTGLYNAEAFQNQVKYKLSLDDQEYGLVNIDIEHFKLFNDWYGTHEGDKLLVYIAEQIQKKVTLDNGVGARLGGDDFMMLLPQEKCVVSQIEKEVTGWMQNYDTDVKFLPAGGIYLIHDKTMSITLMCDRAVLALNSIKGNYAKRVAIYNSTMKQKLADEQEILFGVKKGLQEKQFNIYFQPQCSARTNKIIGAEALVRWNHPVKGMLPPNEFIPLLETSGFISKLDYYVWDGVCAFLHQRLQKGLRVVPISVNVSRMDIYQYNITQVFQNLIKKYNLNPKLIEIEITESAYTEDFDHLIEAVAQLRNAGFIVLMDDFGSGYSSLNMLKDIEIDVLKIDMKFLEISEKSALKGSNILESIIQMGKWLGLRLIAEGVETEEQVSNLLNLDCEYMQGYYFYKPMPIEQFEKVLGEEEHVDSRGMFAKRLPSIQLDDLFHKDITSEAMLSNILGGVALYEITDDKDLAIKMVNDSYFRMTGCNAVDLCERSEKIIKQVHPDDLPIIWDIFHRAEKSTVFGASGVFRRYRLSGEIMWMHLNAFFLRKQGNKKMFYGAISDYTNMMNLQKDMMRLLDTIPGNVIETRVKDHKIISQRIVCAGLAEVHGYTRDEYLNVLKMQTEFEFVHQDDRERVKNIVFNPEQWHDHMNFEYRTYTKDGKMLWLEHHIRFVETEEGIDIYNQLCTDITLIKSQESELMESQTILQNILGITSDNESSVKMAKSNRENAAYLFSKSLPGGMIGGYCEDGFPIYFANDEIVKLLGYDSYHDMVEDIHGLVENTIYKEDRNDVNKVVKGAFSEGAEYSVRYRMVKKDGSLIWVIDKGRVVQAEDGRMAIISYCMDINETMNTKIRLEEAQADVSLLNSLVPGGYHQCYCTPELELKHMSDRFLSMLGFTREEIKERFDNKIVNLIVPENRDVICRVLTGIKENGTLFTEQYQMYTATGKIWVRNQIRLVTHGEEKYFAAIIEDISEVVMMQEKMKAIVANTPGDVFSVENGEIIYYSYNLAKTMGCELEEYKNIIQKTKGKYFTDPRDRKLINEKIITARKECKDIDFVFRSITKNGENRYIHLKATYTDVTEGNGVYYGIMIDATASIIKEQELNISQQMFDSIIHQANLDVWEYDIYKDRLQLSEAGFNQISNQIPICVIKKNNNYILNEFMKQMECKELFTPKTYHVLSMLKEKIVNRDFSNIVIDFSVYNQTNQWMKITCEGIYNNEGELVNVIGYFQDVTKQIEKEVVALEEKKYAQFDSLTGIYNRRMGEILIQNLLSQQNQNHTSALLMIDLDDFKQINDNFGHLIGDHVLKSVSNCIQKNLNEDDIFCRLGGDEFLVYTNIVLIDELKEKIEKITNCIGTHNGCESNRKVQVTLSIGVSLSPKQGNDLQTLYQKADVALYYVKSHGKNNYQIYDEKENS